MEPEPIYLPIRKVHNVRHACLGLEGTILLFDQRQGAVDSELMIPLELVTISECFRFESRRLIAAVVSLFAPLLLGIGSLILLCGSVSLKTANSTGFAVLGTILLLGMPLAGLIAFFVLLTWFFFRVRTVRLDVRPSGPGEAQSAGMTIEFYRSRKRAAEIDHLLEEIRRRQQLIRESLTAPVNRTAGFVKEHSIIPRLAALLYLAGLPALIMRRLPLLLLPAAVLVWFAYRQIQYERQPREYRRAMRRYLRGDYGDAIEILEGLRDRLADHIPTYFLLAQAYVRERRFAEAMEVMSCVADDCPDAADLMERNIWLFKRIDQRRHQIG